mgnify:CR=1 FL=1
MVCRFGVHSAVSSDQDQTNGFTAVTVVFKHGLGAVEAVDLTRVSELVRWRSEWLTTVRDRRARRLAECRAVKRSTALNSAPYGRAQIEAVAPAGERAVAVSDGSGALNARGVDVGHLAKVLVEIAVPSVLGEGPDGGELGCVTDEEGVDDAARAVVAGVVSSQTTAGCSL